MPISTDGKDSVISDPAKIAIKLVHLHTALQRTVELCKDWQKDYGNGAAKAFNDVWPHLNMEIGKLIQHSRSVDFPKVIDSLMEQYGDIDEAVIQECISDLLGTVAILDGVVGTPGVVGYPLPDQDHKEEWYSKINEFTQTFFSEYNNAARMFQDAAPKKFPWITPVLPVPLDVKIDVIHVGSSDGGEPYL